MTTVRWTRQYTARKNKDPSKEPDMSDVMHAIRLKGRDNVRTPMMWDESPNYGFTAPSSKPWIKFNDEYPDIIISKQEKDPNSVLNYFKKQALLRKQQPVMVSLFVCVCLTCSYTDE